METSDRRRRLLDFRRPLGNFSRLGGNVRGARDGTPADLLEKRAWAVPASGAGIGYASCNWVGHKLSRSRLLRRHGGQWMRPLRRR
jgi:hypothetical protein